MKQVIYSEHHRGIVEYPLLKMPNVYDEKYNTAHNWFLRQDFEADFEAYNKWLSSPPIAQVQKEFIEFFSVPRGESEYEIKTEIENIPNVGEAVARGFYTKKVAIPIKEADLETGFQSTNEAVVASHSCTVGNSIQHELKTWSEYFKEVESGAKTFEFRRNDRDFRVGHILILREGDLGGNGMTDHDLTFIYTGRELYAKVTHILHGGKFGIPEGFCIMSIKVLNVHGSVATEAPSSNAD